MTQLLGIIDLILPFFSRALYINLTFFHLTFTSFALSYSFNHLNFNLLVKFNSFCSLNRVSGIPVLWGWDKVSIEGLVWYPKEKSGGIQPDKAVAVGIVIEDIRLDELMEKILGDNFFKTAWFSEMVASMQIYIL